MYEYKIVTFHKWNMGEDALNQLGKEGYRLRFIVERDTYILEKESSKPDNSEKRGPGRPKKDES